MIKGFILAAGYSTRLRPITEHIPKPLMPIAGEVLLDYIVKNLSVFTKEIGINLHYKADEMQDYIKKQNLPLKTFYEKEILLTGGALWNAKEFLKNSVFVVHNGDIYSDADIKEALNWHIENENAITLLVHDCKAHNKLIIDESGNLVGIGSSENSLAFSGIAIYSPQILDLLPDGPSSIIDLWFKAAEKRLKVKIFRIKYNFWFDIGSVEGYVNAVFDKLRRNFTSIYIHSSASGCELIEPEGKVVVERDVKIKKPFRAKNIIVLPETELAPESRYLSDLIIGRGFKISIGKINNTESLISGGSDRRYFRKDNKVFCEWEKLSEDFEKTILLNRFFSEKKLPLPKIIEIDRDRKTIVFEDLGDLTLYSWLQCKRKDEDIESIYKKIVETIGRLHWKISKEAIDLNLPEFDYSYFLWESNYFLKECVKEFFKIDEDLDEDFERISEILSKAEKVILHRDLQSQNIILKNGKIYFVDYQSARWGPAAYDIASLLWDPYVKIKDEIRKRVVDFYIKIHGLDEEKFLKELYLCRIQRHMQALGAYGFLSLKKGKKSFLKFIPYAIDLLLNDFEDCHIHLPKIKAITLKLRQKCKFLL